MFSSLISAFGLLLVEGIGFLTGFITSGSAFPKPLRPEEERELLLKKEAGDEGARNILIERNLRLVAHVVKKFDNTGEDTEDLISIGVIGLIKAINTFDPGKNTRLATYAARCIENENSLSMGNADLPIRLHPVGLAVDHQVAAGAALLADHHLGGGDLYLQAVAPEEQAEGIALPATG